MRYRGLIPVVILLLLAGAGQAGAASSKKEAKRWNKAVAEAQEARGNIARIAVYERFIEKYPKSPHVSEAWKSIAAIRFTQAEQDGTLEAYVAFLELHPQGALSAAARQRALEIRYDQTLRAGTEEAYRSFLENHPEGAEADEARRYLRESAFQRARKTGSMKAYQEFLSEYSQSSEAELARAWLVEERLWIEAVEENSRGGFVRYLDRYPEGRHHETAFDRNRRLGLLDRTQSLLGAWALVDSRMPPDLKRPMLFVYVDEEDRVIFYMEARRLHGGEPVAESYTALVGGPPVLHRRMWDAWQRSVREVDGELVVEEFSPKFPDISSRDRYFLEGGRLKSDRVVRKGLPYREEYELATYFGTEKFWMLLKRSQNISEKADLRHREVYTK